LLAEKHNKKVVLKDSTKSADNVKNAISAVKNVKDNGGMIV